jgi:hypothetical protein
MNEEEKIGKEVTRLLNHGLNEISPNTLRQLRSIRKTALESYQPTRKISHVGSGIFAYGGHHWFSTQTTKLLLSAMLLLILIVSVYWKINYEIDEKIAIDDMILVDDLPDDSDDAEDGYLHNELDTWLDSTP